MATVLEQSPGAIDALEDLVARFDPDVIDVPGGRARIRLEVSDDRDVDAVVTDDELRLQPRGRGEADARLRADSKTWAAIADDVRGGMEAFRAGRLQVRGNLHLGVGLLAATSGSDDPHGLRFDRIATANHDLSILEAGAGPPLICLHGLGGTKASFMTTVSALAPEGNRVIAVDLPGFGDSDMPRSAPFDAPWFATVAVELLDALGLERASFAGNSMGGRIALELGISHAERVERLVLLAPSLAWLRERPLKWLLQMPLPRLGYLQPTPRWAIEPIVRRLVPGAGEGWTAAGVDEFLRAYCTPAGRYAFYECARNIYMDEPYGTDGFWTRMKLEPVALFVWGRQDNLVPLSFMRHVERALPRSRHLELECGHVPQLEEPAATHEAMAEFLASS